MAENITIVLRANAEQAVRAFDEASRAFTGAADRMSAIGGRLTTGLTLPLAAISVGAVRAAAVWDTAMTAVAKTVDAPAARLKQLGQEFVSLSEKIPVASTELAAIGAQAGQLGIATENILGFTKVVAALGVSTNLSSEAAGNALARLSNIMGTSQTDFDRMGSSIVDLGNNLATTEAEIVDFGLRIAGAGKIAGLTEADVLAIGAALSSVGIQAEAGGTAVQKALISMNTAVATGSADLETFAQVAGTTADEFARQWREKPIEGFRAFIEGLRREGDNAVPVIQDLFDRNERLIRSFLSLANAGDLLERSVKLSSEAWRENTALSKEAEKFYERLAAQFVEVANKARNVAAELGAALAPSARTAADAASGFLDVMRGGIRILASMPAPLRTTVVAVGALAAAAGPAALAIATMMRAWGYTAGLRAAITSLPLVTAAVTRLTIALPGLTVALRTLGSATVIGAVVTGVALLTAAFARSEAVAREATESWRALLDQARTSIAGLDSSQVLERFLGARSQRDTAERLVKEAKERLAEIEAQRREQLPSQLGKFRREHAAEVATLTDRVERFSALLPELRAKVAVLEPEFQRLQTAEFAAARAAAELNRETSGVAAAVPLVSLKLTELAEVQDDLKSRIESSRKELLRMQLGLSALETGSDAWVDLNDSIAKTTQEIRQAETALRAVNAELAKMVSARVANLDFSKLGIPGIDPKTGLPLLPIPRIATETKDGKQVPISPTLSAPTQLADAVAAMQKSTQASAFGLTVEQFDMLEASARAAGVSTEEYARAIGLSTKAQIEWKSVAITGIGSVVAAFASGFADMRVVVVQSFSQILQGLAQKGGPLGGILGGLGVPIFGAVGGILAAVLSKKNRETQSVRVDAFSRDALDQQKSIQPPPPKYDIILVDARGNEISRTAAGLKRLEALDGVTRLPGYSPVGG